jgi:hypothetical protein
MKDKTKTNKLNKNSGQPELTQLICDLAPQKKKKSLSLMPDNSMLKHENEKKKISIFFKKT